MEIKEKGTLKPESQKSRIPSKEKEFGNENKNEAKEGLSKKGNDESKVVWFTLIKMKKMKKTLNISTRR